MKLLNLWIRKFQISLHLKMIYRWNFLFDILALILFGLVSPIITLIIYSLSSGVPGWNMYEFLLLTGIFTFVTGIWHTFFLSICWLTNFLIIHGEFDNVLIKPYNPLIYLITGSVYIDGFATIFTGLIVIIFAISKLSITITFINFIYMIAVIVLALIFLLALSIFVASLSIKFIHATAVLDLIYHIVNVGKYPLTIYGAFGAFVLTFVLPFGLAAYYPAQAFLNQLSPALFIKLLIITLCMFLISLYFWNASIKAYSSAGG